MENNPTIIPYIHHSGNRYTFSENLQRLFTDLIRHPFENHPPTPAWQNEVRNRNATYHRDVILDRGRTNFDEPFNGLSPENKVLIYCNHYMPMHLTSSYHIFRVHSRFFKTHFTSLSNTVVFIDLGCGPLTSGIAFWAFARQNNIIYLGVDCSRAMIDKVKEINQYGPNQYRDPFFNRLEVISDYTQLTELLDNFITRADKTPIIFNFCYFLASRTLDISILSDIIIQIVGEYSNHNICMVYQNPDFPQLHENWEILRANLSGFRSRIIESSIQWFRYDSLITDSPHETNVYNDILYKE